MAEELLGLFLTNATIDEHPSAADLYEERPHGDAGDDDGLVAAPGQRILASSAATDGAGGGGGRGPRTRRASGRRGGKRRPAAGGLWTGEDDDDFDVGDGEPRSMHEELLAVLHRKR